MSSSGEENIRVGDMHHLVGFDLRPLTVITDDIGKYMKFNIRRKHDRIRSCLDDLSSGEDDVLTKGSISLIRLLAKDPRIRDYLDRDMRVTRLAYSGMLANENSQLKVNSALLIPRLRNWRERHLSWTFDTLKRLIRTKSNEMCYEVLITLTAIACDYPFAHEAIIDGGLVKCLCDFFHELRPQDLKAITQCAIFVSVFCCKNPRLPPQKKEVVLDIVKTIFQSDDIDGVMPHACYALYCLSYDQYLQIGERDFRKLVWLLLWNDSLVTIPALMVLGNIIRWGPDHQIKFFQSMIVEGSVPFLGLLVEREIEEREEHENEFKLVSREAFWIISNMTARISIDEEPRYPLRSHKTKKRCTHYWIVHLCQVLCSLGKDQRDDKSDVRMVDKRDALSVLDMSDVQMDAAWAIFNYFTQNSKKIIWPARRSLGFSTFTTGR